MTGILYTGGAGLIVALYLLWRLSHWKGKARKVETLLKDTKSKLVNERRSYTRDRTRLENLVETLRRDLTTCEGHIAEMPPHTVRDFVTAALSGMRARIEIRSSADGVPDKPSPDS